LLLSNKRTNGNGLREEIIVIGDHALVPPAPAGPPFFFSDLAQRARVSGTWGIFAAGAIPRKREVRIEV